MPLTSELDHHDIDQRGMKEFELRMKRSKKKDDYKSKEKTNTITVVSTKLEAFYNIP